MAENVSHHYVPKFYFRLFNGGKDVISLLLRKSGRIIPSASIKRQSARNQFYGSVDFERNLAGLEGQHSEVLRLLLEIAGTDNLSTFKKTDFIRLLQAVALQRARTILEVEKNSPARCESTKTWFLADIKLRKSPEEYAKIAGAFERGEVEFVENPTQVVREQIVMALADMAHYLVDMRLCILRNKTDYPFIFSDSPVVFYNSYCRRITHRGVLGYRSPGLQIFWPLAPTVQVMLVDSDVYTGQCTGDPLVDVTARGDVSQLNALQLHHSRNVVYFSDPKDAGYITELFETHRSSLRKPEVEFQLNPNFLVNGKRPEGMLTQIFEPHLNHFLSLSFVQCTPIHPADYKFRHRTVYEDD